MFMQDQLSSFIRMCQYSIDNEATNEFRKIVNTERELSESFVREASSTNGELVNAIARLINTNVENGTYVKPVDLILSKMDDDKLLLRFGNVIKSTIASEGVSGYLRTTVTNGLWLVETAYNVSTSQFEQDLYLVGIDKIFDRQIGPYPVYMCCETYESYLSHHLKAESLQRKFDVSEGTGYISQIVFGDGTVLKTKSVEVVYYGNTPSIPYRISFKVDGLSVGKGVYRYDSTSKFSVEIHGPEFFKTYVGDIVNLIKDDIVMSVNIEKSIHKL